jgi:biotin carboxyl carrier protein
MNEFVVTLNNKKITIIFNDDKKVLIDGKEYVYSLSKLNNSSYQLLINNKSHLITSIKKGNSEYILTLNGQVLETKVLSVIQEKASRLIEAKKVKHSETAVKSPMPGMILKIKKKAGDSIVQGDSILILEAMKMENDIRSQVSGKIKEIKVKEGQAVEKNTILFSVM